MRRVLHSCYIPKFFSLLILLLPLLASGASLKISTNAPQGGVEVGRTFNIIIEANNLPGDLDISQMPPGVKLVYKISNNTSGERKVNGHVTTSSTTNLILTFKAQTPGTYRYGPVRIGGVSSNTISYKIVPQGEGGTDGGNASPDPNDPQNFNPNQGPLFIGKGNEEMFLRAQVNKTSVYEQEAIEYTVKLYTSYDVIKFMGAAAAPKFEGFVIEESDVNPVTFSEEVYNGKRFHTAIIARYIIFPQKAGRLKVLGNTYTVSTDTKQYYHDPYFQTMVARYPIQLNVTPNDIEVNVKALPTPVPDNFIGGVGQFRISSSMPKRNLATNTPASLVYTIEGTGNIKYLKFPELNGLFPSSLEIYSPENTVDAKVSGANVSGSSKFDFSIVPRETGRLTIPSITLTYFDPSDGQYKTLKTEAYSIDVSMGQSSSRSQQALTFSDKLLPVGKPSLKIREPYVFSILYWLWFVIPVVIFILALGYYRKYLKDHEDITILRSKRANKMALKRLARAYQCIKDKKEEQFYDEMLAALWGYIGDKLKMPTSELNRSNVGEEFKKHGVKESTFMPIINLIDECEYAKYTPVERDANMRQLYYQAVDSLAKVENEYEEETGTKDNDTDDSDDNLPTADNYVNTSIPDSQTGKVSDTGNSTDNDVTSTSNENSDETK